jgi:hypothetical protein
MNAPNLLETAGGESPGNSASEPTSPAPHDPIRNLLESCLRMLKLTGGSQYWTGDTQAALEFMEAAVAEALEVGAARIPQIPQTETRAVLPEITASRAATVDHGLQMPGIETERWRSAI